MLMLYNTDFSKAFDRVSLKVLLSKLTALCLPLSGTNWLGSYLNNSLFPKNFLLSDIVVYSGVPQGSDCGSILFLLFLNDIGRDIKYCSYLLFADDMKSFKTIASADDSKLLQLYLDNVNRWCTNNNLFLNLNNCLALTYKGHNCDLFDYKTNDIKLN